MKNISLLSYAAAALIVTILAALIYVSVQQSHRSGANDPQLEIARDMRDNLKSDSLENSWVGDKIDIAKSLSVFRVLYDKNGEPLQSTGLLDGHLPKMPKGVFDFAKKNGEHVLSWQPYKGVRMAMVIESVQSTTVGFVAVGRSLLEVEKRVNDLTIMILLAWLGCVGVLFFHWLIFHFQKKDKSYRYEKT